MHVHAGDVARISHRHVVTSSRHVRRPHLTLVYLGSRDLIWVLGRWKTTENRGFRVLLKEPFFTALAALEATVLASCLPGRSQRT